MRPAIQAAIGWGGSAVVRRGMGGDIYAGNLGNISYAGEPCDAAWAAMRVLPLRVSVPVQSRAATTQAFRIPAFNASDVACASRATRW